MKAIRLILFSLLIVVNFDFVFSQESKPNVLMIVLDDLNDYVGVLGGHPQAKTPNIDRLANEGVLFTNAHSNAPVCAPSRASFMAGILPSTSKNFYFDNWLDNDILVNSKILPEYFSENGYKTYKTGKITHSMAQEQLFWDYRLTNSLNYGPFAYNGNNIAKHPSSNLEYYESSGALDGTIARLSDIPNVLPNGDNPGYNGWWSNGPFSYINEENRDFMPDEKSVNWLQNQIESLENSGDTTPFFMALGLIRPHSPLIVPDKYFDMFPLDEVQIPKIKINDRDDTYFSGGEIGYDLFNLLENEHTDRQLGLRKKVQAYLACVAFADDMVGQILTSLENSSFKDNTIVMLFSDHGYHVGEKDYLRKNALWNEATRVPLIIKSPAHQNNAGSRVNHPVSLVDIYPTLKDLCNLSGENKKNENGANLDGHSLKPFLENPNTTSWPGPSSAISSVGMWGSYDPSKQNFSIVSKRYRYTKYKNGDEELYDHLYDYNEWINVSNRTEYVNVKKELEEQLKKQAIPKLILKDSLVDFSKVYDHSNNWQFVFDDSDNLINDPEHIVRTNTENAHITYRVDDLKNFEVDLWGIRAETPADFGSIKAFVAGDDQIFNEISVDYIEKSPYGWRGLFVYEPTEIIPENTKYIRFELSSLSGVQAWKALIGTIWLFDDGSQNKLQNSIDDIAINIDESIFEVPESNLRTNDKGLPSFSDNLETTNNTYRSSGNFYISTINADDYDGDSNRIVRNNENIQDLELVYKIDALNHFRVEFWTFKDRALETVFQTTGTIKAFTSSNSDSENDYIEIPLRFIRIKIIDNWILYAIVPEHEIENDVSFFKLKVSGGEEDEMWGAQYGAIHLYENSLSNNNGPLSINTNQLDSSLSIYPNPTKDKFIVEGLKEHQNISIYNTIGELVYQTQSKNIVDIKNLKSGLYFLKIGNLKTFKLIKK